MANIIEKIFHLEKRELNKYYRESEQVLAYDEAMSKLTDDELRHKTIEFKEKLKNGASLESIKYEAYAVAREAGWRVLHQKPFQVQIIGSLVLNNGDIAEMKTGEGKTLTETMAVYLNALTGKGVHVITVNEYLASRDAEWMGQIYRFLGLTVGVNLASKSASEKREAYACDITYTTNSELGFDYLRDNMSPDLSGRVLRGLYFCVVDEADSVLIDESRTPLIISGGSRTAASQYQVADRFVKALKKDVDFTIDIKEKTCSLTDEGNNKAERMFGIRNLYDPEYQDLVHRIHQALKANYIMARDVEYMVDDKHTIQLIDQFTGRIMPGREYNDGLQQAIQAKEGVEIKQETVVMATITYQNFFRLYEKLSGMTGTAKTEEEEFETIYNMKVIVIPTNKPIQRIDAPDYIFGTHKEKLDALVKAVKERHEKGQPILIGTVSVESNEEISSLLTAAGVPHEVLNAKNQAREAEIISHAGEKGAVTLATNMAGRGTDIKLDDEAKAAGGLKIIGTERHESRRIDNQLRGRAGRQGDPGESQFFISLEDDLMRLFGSERLMGVFNALGVPEGEQIQHKMLTSAIEKAQEKIEANNFGIRKNLLEYDQVDNDQREIIYSERMKVLNGDNMRDAILKMVQEQVEKSVDRCISEEIDRADWDLVELNELVLPVIPLDPITKEDIESIKNAKQLKQYLKEKAVMLYEQKETEFPEPEQFREIERVVLLRVIDRKWMDHIDDMAQLRQGIGLQAYGQKDPIVEYKMAGFDMFDDMISAIQEDTVRLLYHVQVEQKVEREQVAKISGTNKDESAQNAPKRRAAAKVYPNDPCPCGSGKKYKQCCGRVK